jgi:hypothetical protein
MYFAIELKELYALEIGQQYPERTEYIDTDKIREQYLNTIRQQYSERAKASDA